ncbi:MAG TPA: acetyl-CoA carboxylase, carboxyltransferase subunit beta [Clostridiaceae bacterium]|nr:acetyl-CoA carboxylase, carboxyltransferase subunit beta [Clostridiaceae bacterium]
MSILKKKRNYFSLHTHGVEEEKPSSAKPLIPEGLYLTCPHCNQMIRKEPYLRNFKTCPKCGGYGRLSAKERLDLVLEEGTFKEINGHILGGNPLGFPGYEEKLIAVRNHTGLKEGVLTGYGFLGETKVAIGSMDPGFIMGSMGSAVGEKLASLCEFATFYELPLIIFSASGGARMQEGIMSLMQMSKVSFALKKHHDQGLLYISVPTDPTTGGVTASFASLGDLIIAEPKTLIGFAGRRVIEGTIKKELPKDFQTAEFLLHHGFLDAVVKRESLKGYLERILRLHGGRR